ncbi:hypothetical protein A0H81_10320 [Grifola frondosa]|uniref:Uncharacterized protein n=1 Tax=Grifola frondosa TaxID=5627 RepID=A0A1C7M3F7_GRIFR|nr:hypothetical protein A0H81_10320 [Grifola frondosa]
MLIINQRLDKIAAIRVAFATRGMLDGPCIPLPPPHIVDSYTPPDLSVPTVQVMPSRVDNADEEEDDQGAVEGPTILGEVLLAKSRARGFPSRLAELAHHIDIPDLPSYIRRFLYDQLYPDAIIPSHEVNLERCPDAPQRIAIYPSAVATFHAPSDQSGVGGMHRERIRSVASWHGGPPRRDCAFVEKDPNLPGFRGLHVVRVLLFLSFKHYGVEYPCALVTWFSPVDDEPCKDTGMWIVEPDVDYAGRRIMSVLHLDTMLRSAHLIGVAGKEFLPRSFKHSDSLDAFKAFYVNKFADHHAYEIAF